MKKLLNTQLCRAKLIYGIETIKMSKKEVNENLGKFEKTLTKKPFKISYYSKTTPLFYGLKITPINLWIIKRKIHFLIQLMNYKATKELILEDYCRTLSDILEYIGIKDKHKTSSAYEELILSACTSKLRTIYINEDKITKSPMIRLISHLLNKMSEKNRNMVQFILDPRRCQNG